MRENISTIFAVIIGVVVLIIFPLFSIMSRQDSISYNRVLTLTTEFVDRIRSTGYLTEQDYTNYIVNLSKTNNSYNIQMEYHEKILIKDVNNISQTLDEQGYVEDTLIYYNKDINKKLVENNGKINFNENDEFYVKIYNTNITTASLLYNYFARVRVAPKVINIGYGGKISHITGLGYVKTDFSDSYSPYIKLGEIVDIYGNNNKTCYDSNSGTYDIQTCVRIFRINENSSLTITLPFEMHNFEKIIRYTYNEDNEKISSETLDIAKFKDNKIYITNTIKDAITLRGIEADSGDEGYIVDIKDLSYDDGVIKGIIEISNIHLPDSLSIKATNVVISQGLGIGPTGIISAEAKSHEIIIAEKQTNPNFEVLGPFKEQKISNSTASSIDVGETAYFKVRLTDYESELDIQLRNIDTNEIVDKSEYSIIYVEEAAKKEYWIKISSYYSLFDKNFVLEVITDKPVEGEKDKTITEKAMAQSTSFKYNKVDYTQLYTIYGYYETTTNGISVIRGYLNIQMKEGYLYKIRTTNVHPLIFSKNVDETKQFIDQYTNKLAFEVEELPSGGEISGRQINYTTKLNEYTYDGSNLWGYDHSGAGNGGEYNMITYGKFENSGYTINYDYVKLYFTITMNLSSTEEQFYQEEPISVKAKPMAGAAVYPNNYHIHYIYLLGLKIPEGFTHTQEGTNIYITDNNDGLKFQWITKSSLSDNGIEESSAEYTKLTESLKANNGYYLLTSPLDITYTNNYPLNTDEDKKNNNIYYWREVWDAAVSKYKDNPDVASHIPFSSQITTSYKTAYANTWTASKSYHNLCKFYYLNQNGENSCKTDIDFSKLKYGLALYLK